MGRPHSHRWAKSIRSLSYGQWMVSVCWAGLPIDPNCISHRGRDFPAELLGHRGAPDFSVSAHKSIDVHVCVY